MRILLFIGLFLIFIFNPFLSNGQEVSTEQIEKDGHKSGNKQAVYFLNLSKKIFKEDPDSGLYYVQKSIESAKSNYMYAQAYYQQALIRHSQGKQEDALRLLDKAILKVGLKPDTLVSDVLHLQNIINTDKGLYKIALEKGHLEWDLRKKLKDPNGALNAVLQIGYTYDRLGDYKQAISWYRKGFEIKNAQNQDYIGRNYGLIGIAYDELGTYDSAIYYNLKAVDYFKKVDSSIFLYSWYSNLGNTYTKMGKLDLAEKYTLMALEDKGRKRYSTIINLGKIYLEQKEYKKAEQILKDVAKELKTVDQKLYLSEAYYRLYELYFIQKDYQTALAYLKNYTENEQIRLSEQQIKEVSELSIRYETQQKENLILQQQNHLAESRLKIRNRTFWILGLSSASLFLVIIAILLYKQQVLKVTRQHKDNLLRLAKARIENQERLKEQRTIISRDLHDNIGAHLTFIISSVDTLKQISEEGTPDIIGRLDGISTFARNTLRELRDTIWVINKPKLTLEDLKSRIANFIDSANQSTHTVKVQLEDSLPSDYSLSFNSKIGMDLYRMVQEAVSNALKYAEANQIKVCFSLKSEDALAIKIEDDGKGFDPKTCRQGNGLRNMKSRAEKLHGTLDLTTSEAGTRLIFIVPLNDISDEA